MCVLMTTSARNFCFTYNIKDESLPTDNVRREASDDAGSDIDNSDNGRYYLHMRDVLERVSRLGAVEYGVAQMEEAPTTGRIHVQGFVRHSRAIRATAIRKRLQKIMPGS